MRFSALWQHDQVYVPVDAVEGFFACVKIALGVHPQREDVRAHARAALNELIYRHIEDNLGDPDLTPGSLLEAFGVSRSSLFRMFEPRGGVRNYIMERRAIRAVLDISTSPPERGVLREISEKWGFSTQPNFNRTIQRLFGASPGRLFGEDSYQGATFRRHSDAFTWSHQAVERVAGQVA